VLLMCAPQYTRRYARVARWETTLDLESGGGWPAGDFVCTSGDSTAHFTLVENQKRHGAPVLNVSSVAICLDETAQRTAIGSAGLNDPLAAPV
jgi:hypothetical protein